MLNKKPKKPTIFDYGFTVPRYEASLRLWNEKKEKIYNWQQKIDSDWGCLFLAFFLVSSILGFYIIIKDFFNGILSGIIFLILIPVTIFLYLTIKSSYIKYLNQKIDRIKTEFKDMIEYEAAIKDYETKIQEIVEKEKRMKVSFWLNLSPYEFESEVSKLFSIVGYDARVTKGSGDEGIDILIKKNNKIGFVQCKKYKNMIGPAAARQLYGVMVSQKTNKGILVSMNGFSEGCLDFCKKVDILCLELHHLINLDQMIIDSYMEK